MNLLRLLGRSGLARTDGPHGLVSYHERGELLGSEVVNHLLDLSLNHVEVLLGLALLQILAHAVDGFQTVGVSLLHLLVQRLRSLAVVLATLRVAQNDVLAAERGDHRSRNLARVGSLGLGGAVLRAHGDIRTLNGLHDLREVGEGRAYDEVHARAHLAATCDHVLGQLHALGGQSVHFPVSCNNFLSHNFLFELYYVNDIILRTSS